MLGLRDNCNCDALLTGRSLPFGWGDEDSLRRLRQLSFPVKTSLQALGLVDADWRYLQATLLLHIPNHVRQERARPNQNQRKTVLTPTQAAVFTASRIVYL